MTEEKLPFTAHLAELRKRLIISLIAIGVGTLLCSFFADRILNILVYPLIKSMPKEGSLIFTGLPDLFIVYFKISFFGGIFLSSPLILFELYSFVAPGLYKKERRYILFVTLGGIFSFLIGTLFAYFVFFPSSFKFFLNFGADTQTFIKPMLTIGGYLSFFSKLILAFGFIFQLPIVILFLSRIGIVTKKQLKGFRKYAIVLIFIAAAVLTPTPDAINQLFMAIPLLILYEISILMITFFGKKQ